MRGEEGLQPVAGVVWGELPPHARRRALFEHGAGLALGITSACAEKRA